LSSLAVAIGSTSPSVKLRFLVSVGANGLRAGLSFLAGLLVARGLQPAAYGDLMFLFSSFVAVRMLLDLGTSNAYYTFIAQRRRPLRFHLYYGLWLFGQFFLTFLGLWVLLPDEVIQRLWFGHSRGILMAAFLAIWLQQHWWMTISQIGEAERQTLNVQRLNSLIAVVHILLVAFLFYQRMLSAWAVIFLIIGEYVIATLLSWEILQRICSPDERDAGSNAITARDMIGEFWAFSLPLAVLGIVGFGHDFFDRWMLQRFGGGNQQGFYQIAFQFASVSQLATVSILNIFWKEIAEAQERGDIKRVADLYRKVNQGLVFFTSAVSGFLIPWTQEIIALLLGQSWGGATTVLSLMFLYPIHQAMGQIHSTMFLASNRTLTYMQVSLFIMFLGLPVSYLVQAPPSAPWIPGWGLGAMGLSIKTLVMTILSVNLLSYFVSRIYGWNFEWLYQPISMFLCLGVGFLIHAVILWIPWPAFGSATFLLPMALAAIGCFFTLAMLVRVFPWLVGFHRDEAAALIQTVRTRFGF